MSNYIPPQSSGEQGPNSSVPSYQPYQPSEPQAYQPSADGWGQPQGQPAYGASQPASAPSYGGQADPNYNPNAYASGYQSYGASSGGYQSQSSGGTNVLAILSLVASIVGFLFIWILGPVAGIVLAHFAKKQIAETGENGSGLATAGWWTGWVGLALQILGIIAYFALFAVLFSAGATSY